MGLWCGVDAACLRDAPACDAHACACYLRDVCVMHL